MFIFRENSRRSWILLFPDRPKFCPLTETRNLRYLRSSGIVGNKSFPRRIPDFCDGWWSFLTNENSNLYHRGRRRWFSLITNPFVFVVINCERSASWREFISFKLRVSSPFTFESQNNAIFFWWGGGDHNISSVTMNSSVYKINNNRVLKCDVIKNQICEIMGFASIFWKSNIREAYLPKTSIVGQIASEILAQLCSLLLGLNV